MNMDANTEVWLADLDADLRKKKDRSDALDELFQLTFLGDAGIRQKASWCVAKMGQNKISDMRILDILAPLTDDEDDTVRENVAWGIGEVAGADIGDERSIDSIIKLLDDDVTDVKGMAAWAAGRLKHKLNLTNKHLEEKLISLSDDPSEFVRKSALFALE
ncbi:MAG: HEAT repeat domain-containing protein, partial [Candidatus Methanomethylophilaceae archaeon]